MTAQTATLADFLLARIAEDEEVAPYVWAEQFTPARLLAECAAKRRLVSLSVANLSDTGAAASGRSQMAAASLRLLAQPYASHPDFREEWRA